MPYRENEKGFVNVNANSNDGLKADRFLVVMSDRV